ncbi:MULTISPECIES: NAD(P)/FAD-dependent oxidoreductase [unclassified Bradyrhizobium]|uniref:flavin-containing monooxygenase n=1 Tax=unclassified Bradyrhizobium TaxID=2631580 RepID=UPI001BA57966|nr:MULTISPECIES: NAD(P)/FAD-dependent oxidoreductase [unclassified Bradyrhizobium]MBR1207833.1 NAD(P)/FAD-dependent oxidoreductase [Bradyrhizobium sp. AUGA SZCCT0124]MBR1316372.1 NAD(P)/FAD-dependent oxidoreductase [Bradyrhizobium sp. AUGA SZCCT0051]MBR1344383.1 NAD(P)/FAD-dependent oxidoreductase [Bradyrhizobium sp. AUGA SZCCT0105]MBR1359394.1 NAD(P)/FAD-dependent oxidoreductase [Bradyrhizobium sp. AUGA SZCCT0045]
MTETVTRSNGSNGARATTKLDAVVVGAGVAGLYQLFRLREQGLSVKAIDAGSSVGGTWYWNRYPGARFDSEGHTYQYLFSEELYKGWSWSERFPGQPEIERWLNYVADRLDLRKDIQFGTTVKSAHFNEATQRWLVTTDQGDVIDTQFLVTCCGMLSAPHVSFPGQETFKGELFHTARWPKGPIELAGKRVGVVGNGATGIQVIQSIAGEVGHLKVFIRTPQYIIPMKNPKWDAADAEAYKSKFKFLTERLPKTFTGFEFDFEHVWADLTPQQRRQVIGDCWNDGSLKLWVSSFAELFFDEAINAEITEFVREKMRERIKDPKLCEQLIPSDYGFGTHRVPLESNFLEAFHRPNVEIVSVKDNPIARITPEGIQTADGTVHAFDVIILATGFDAGTGALTRIDIRGREGRSLKDDWGRDIRTTMGLQVHGYPNLFTTAVPLAPSAALCNMTTCLQQQVEWIADCINYLRGKNLNVIEPTRDAEDQWVAHHDETANATLIAKTNSWYLGSNVEGKPRRVLSYCGGVGTYRQKCDEVAASGYQGFAMQ